MLNKGYPLKNCFSKKEKNINQASSVASYRDAYLNLLMHLVDMRRTTLAITLTFVLACTVFIVTCTETHSIIRIRLFKKGNGE